MGQLYFVRAIGTEQVSEHEPMSLENAKEDLVDLYQKTLENHDNGSWFDDKLLIKGKKLISEARIHSDRYHNIKGKILRNVYIPKDNGETTEIDVVYITQKGIFVIESKNYSGWIFGRENDAEWTETFPRQKHHFPNPIRQNYAHICALAECLGISKDYFHGVVAFTEKCTFKTPMPDGVVYTVGLADYIKSFDRIRIDPSQVPETAEAIRKWAAEVGDNPAKAHVVALKHKARGGSRVDWAFLT